MSCFTLRGHTVEIVSTNMNEFNLNCLRKSAKDELTDE